jgi:thiamine pyrophosphokinase
MRIQLMTLEPDPDNAGGGIVLCVPRLIPWDFFMRSVIFANGKIQNYKDLKPLINHGDFIIAADGGVGHITTLSMLPNIIIGDLDSTSEKDLCAIEEHNIPKLKFSQDKDQSDLELAIQHAIKIGCEEIIIFGALGNRWDHSIGNLLLPIQAEFKNTNIQLWENNEFFYFIKDSFSLEIPINTNVSLFPLLNCENITTTGLKFPLINEPLEMGSPRGLSNISVRKIIQITIDGGLLLCIVGSSDKNNL